MNNLTGRTFGRLTVLGLSGRYQSGALTWRCACECGTEKVIGGSSLTRGHTRSCGCWSREVARKHRDDTEAAWMFNFGQYKRNAAHRGLTVELDFATFKAICEQPCHYCGTAPELRPQQRGRATINASGIDRVNNNIGYTVGNSVPCCTWCNRAKNNMTAMAFVEKCVMVSNMQDRRIARNT